jgi:hypothetical protein
MIKISERSSSRMYWRRPFEGRCTKEKREGVDTQTRRVLVGRHRRLEKASFKMTRGSVGGWQWIAFSLH